jgi:hypothetical protein
MGPTRPPQGWLQCPLPGTAAGPAQPCRIRKALPAFKVPPSSFLFDEHGKVGWDDSMLHVKDNLVQLVHCTVHSTYPPTSLVVDMNDIQ